MIKNLLTGIIIIGLAFGIAAIDKKVFNEKKLSYKQQVDLLMKK